MTCSQSQVRMAAVGAKRAAVVGAGAAGLAAAKQLRQDGHEVRVFEMSNDVGGVWQYEDTVERQYHDSVHHHSVQDDHERVHSSMYASLRTNLPREVMAFDDLEFTDEFDHRRFVHHSAVYKYLSKFADKHKLRPHISFGRKVTKLQPLKQASADETQKTEDGCEEMGFQGVAWALEHAPAQPGEGGGEGVREEFDVVMVCNGHYSEAWSPTFEGSESWPGTTSHAHNYRTPAPFAAKRVVVIGASASGEDISREVSSRAAQVYVSARSWQNPDWGAPDAGPFGPDANIVRKVPIRRLRPDGAVEFEDGSVLEKIDHLLFCTGYRYRFPFLEQEEVVSVDDNFVTPLFYHLLPPEAPSIAFIGLPAKVIPFPQFEAQSRYVSAVWAGKVQLPTKSSMYQSIQEEVEKKRRARIPQKYFHVQGGAMFGYNDELSAMSGGPMTPPWRIMMHNQCSSNKRTYPETYRDIAIPTVQEYKLAIMTSKNGREQEKLAA